MDGAAPLGFRVGVDVGGTFTDIVLVHEASGDILVAKVPTVPADPSEGCLDGFDKALARNAIAASSVSFAVHGTTIATNTIIQGTGAKAGLITSEGFRDVLEIAYQTRPRLYDIFYEKPKPLVPRALCLGVPERTGPEGETIRPLDEEALRVAARQLRDAGVSAIAVSFLHSYRNPANERRAGEIVAAECPGVAVVLSSTICPEYREYPRTSTAVVNAVLLPRVSPYVANLERRLAERGMRVGLHLMTSAGGIIAADTAKREPVTLIESGPAAGVIGAAFVGALAGYENVLALDIGGTTAKAAVVTGGQPQVSDQFEVGAQAVASVTAHRGQGYPVRTPVVALVEIGAGGGSIAHVDPGGALAVGPQSAGAVPGPACYGQGGEEPTLTDANLVLGRIDPAFFLGGEQALDVALAEGAMQARVAGPMGMGLADAARAVVDIANAKMTSALYFISVEQGIDPRDYVLVASGGAGPMQAVAIARALGVRRVLVPPTPGLNSAVGLLATDLKHESVRTYLRDVEVADAVEVSNLFSEMVDGIARLLAAEGVPREGVEMTRIVEMCYVGQSYALRVEVPEAVADIVGLADAAFHELHREAYGYCDTAEPTQIVNLRVIGVGRIARPRLREVGIGGTAAEGALKARRPVHFVEQGGFVETPIYDRARLLRNNRITGPAVVEQMDTTTVIPPGASAEVDRFGNLLVNTGAA